MSGEDFGGILIMIGICLTLYFILEDLGRPGDE